MDIYCTYLGRWEYRIICIFLEIAVVNLRNWNVYLSVWYWRNKKKKDAKKAIVVIARKFLDIIYTMLKGVVG